jgi:hypothetical protein
MTQLDKIALAVADLRARGVWRSTAAPPLYRLLWRLGVAAPPPLFQSFLSLTGVLGAFFGLSLALAYGTALFVAAPDLAGPGERSLAAVTTGVLAGLLFGLPMAVYYRWYARRLGLPAWDEYVPGELTEREPDW